MLFIGCLTSQQHASVSQGWICSDNFTCCHTEIEAADQIVHLIQSQYTDTGLTSPSTDPITPGAWQGSHWSANFQVTGMTQPQKNSRRKRDSNPGPCALVADTLTTRPARQSVRSDWVRQQIECVISPCGSMYNCLCRLISGIHFVCYGNTEQPKNEQIQLCCRLHVTVMSVVIQL